MDSTVPPIKGKTQMSMVSSQAGLRSRNAKFVAK